MLLTLAYETRKKGEAKDTEKNKRTRAEQQWRTESRTSTPWFTEERCRSPVTRPHVSLFVFGGGRYITTHRGKHTETWWLFWPTNLLRHWSSHCRGLWVTEERDRSIASALKCDDGRVSVEVPTSNTHLNVAAKGVVMTRCCAWGIRLYTGLSFTSVTSIGAVCYITVLRAGHGLQMWLILSKLKFVCVI